MATCSNTVKNTLINSVLVFVLACLLVMACSAPNRGLFAEKTAHERYADKISKAGLKETSLGQTWFNAAGKGLAQPLTIKLPYKEAGYFDAAQPEAAGYRFTAKRGDKVIIQLIKKPVTGFNLFLDLWQPVVNGQPRLLTSADTTNASLNYEIRTDGDYLLRLQPELLAGGEYILEIRTGPSLDFPVATTTRPRISSFWGDARDAGARSHEGIDIFGAFRTPLLAAADGNITSVTENRLGGKVVFMRPKGKDFVLYYAHLDSQMVRSGQRVRSGDTIGLMGNTGNARTTPPHLHFGIYAAGGAIDPLPFVDIKRPDPAAIQVAANNLKEYRRSAQKAMVYASPDKQSSRLLSLPPGTLLQLQSATGTWYKIKLPDGQEGFITGDAVNAIATPLRTYKSDTIQRLLDKPVALAASKAVISREKAIQVMGVFNDYYYVNVDNKEGWIMK